MKLKNLIRFVLCNFLKMLLTKKMSSKNNQVMKFKNKNKKLKIIHNIFGNDSQNSKIFHKISRKLCKFVNDKHILKNKSKIKE